MSQPEQRDQQPLAGPEAQRTAKKPYHKPALRYEQVFETAALACLKKNDSCKPNQKAS